MFLLYLLLLTIILVLFTVRGRDLFRTLFRDMPLDWLTINLVIILGVAFLVLALHFDIESRKIGIARLLTTKKQVEFREVLEEATDRRLLKYDVWRLDTDGDGFKEWIVLYRYDLGTRRNPIGGAVYDVDNCRPPAIVSYELIPLDRDYLAEDRVVPSLQNIDGEGQDELMIHGYSISGGIMTELTIFRWVDESVACEKPVESARRYELLGSFRGTGGVRLEGRRVIVKDRGRFERSQLSLKRVYALQDGTYLQPGGEVLFPPVETSIDFSFGKPERVTESYYPEKAILAFYQALGRNNGIAESYLSRAARDAYPMGSSSYGTGVSPDNLTRIRVKAINYDPIVEDERRLGPVKIGVCVASVRPDGTEESPRAVLWEVTGVRRDGALPYNCEWRLNQMWELSFAGCPWPEDF